jgi:hypothetical protein
MRPVPPWMAFGIPTGRRKAPHRIPPGLSSKWDRPTQVPELVIRRYAAAKGSPDITSLDTTAKFCAAATLSLEK